MPTTEAVIGVMFVAWVLGLIKGVLIGRAVYEAPSSRG